MKSNGGTQWFQQDRVYSAASIAMCCPAGMSGGSYLYEIDVWDGYNRRIRKEKSTVGALTTKCGADLKRNGQGEIEKKRVRRLTPRECFRLMDFDDADFDKAAAANKDTRLYEQAGNSIVVAVLEAIFKEML